ncbi:MAG: LysR family transcriptional regulator [Pedosphaera sp.]|nr:LysR family transcriptional regulator [Pedosphaera sp.]
MRSKGKAPSLVKGTPKRKSEPTKTVEPRFRLRCRENIAMGPGKAELLEQVQAMGSIAEAAGQLGMSYMRAWTLIKTMQQCFKKPLVTVARGGAGHGGAALTESGKQVLSLYREMEKASLQASKPAWQKLLRMMS